MPRMGEIRANAGLYPVVIAGAAILILLGFALLGWGAATMPNSGTAGTSGTIESACTGFTCAPLLVPVILVVVIALVLGVSAVMRATA